MDVNEMIREIAYRIRKYRELHHITREEFCEKTGQNVEYWGTIERGERNISLNKLIEVCITYDIDISEFVRITPVEEDNSREIRAITEKLSGYSAKQLAVLTKFMDEILPNI